MRPRKARKGSKTQQREAAETLIELSAVQATNSGYSSTDCSTLTELSSSDIKEDAAKAGLSLLLQNAQLQEENNQLRFHLLLI